MDTKEKDLIVDEFKNLIVLVDHLPEQEKREAIKEIRAHLNRYIYPKNYMSKKKLPCFCGAKQLHASREYSWDSHRDKYYVICPRCMRTGPKSISEWDACIAWNEMIKNGNNKEEENKNV